MLCGLRSVQQAAIGNCLSFDPFPFDQNGLAPPEVDVGGRQVADALVVTPLIAVGNVGIVEIDQTSHGSSRPYGSQASSAGPYSTWIRLDVRLRNLETSIYAWHAGDVDLKGLVLSRAAGAALAAGGRGPLIIPPRCGAGRPSA